MIRLVEFGRWLCGEGAEGESFTYREGDFSREEIAEQEHIDPIENIEDKEGWCWRYVAPGYMDSYPEEPGQWCGPFDTEDMAKADADRIMGELGEGSEQ